MAQDVVLGTDTVKDALKTKVNDDVAELFAAQAALAAGSGVLVSTNDAVVGVLNGKLVAGEAIDFTENNDGANETLTVACEDASTTNKGVSELATDAETVTGTDTTRTCTPANLTAKMSAPGPIGDTTPSTGAFSSIDINGGTIDGTTVGSTTPAAGAFTTLKASTDPVDADGVGDRGYNDLRYEALDDSLGDALMFGGM
jgi:hypothetical protein